MDTEPKRPVCDTPPFVAESPVASSFKPINAIHLHLCAFHRYAQDRSRHIEAHHYCTHISPDLHQCIIYDSDDPNARLIGIEYVVSEKIFASLPPEEKKYWHSHKYEVESGLVQLQTKELIPGCMTDFGEQPAMLALQRTYGKSIHTWAIDATPDLPLGPPSLMMSYTHDDQIDPDMVKCRDEKLLTSTCDKKQLRKGYLPYYEVLPGADEWEISGKGLEFLPGEVNLSGV